ncbi:two-component system OmpR family sensor kinase [Cryobacterium mesophilum]|uniref:histidine kinase n=1 Tax=Terrimesophilobacter mesophilus TaxID=433647 RepID=A0A4R8VBQ9_9MICO|nr:HAMP domain-containing sensor histidine kinase [Terrimesophilobacter mesophilus]MBB5632742.1 two-component system OmpR family sensor kinase [Terrimesophilobacter mesophilus]TFB79540.1 HAMP domain-containing histidine kinase [Terrimesophilobacter mesophilus]
MHDQLSQWWGRVSLRTKTTAVTVLLLTVGLLVAGVGTMTVLRNYLVGEVDRKVSATALDLRALDLSIQDTCDRAAGPSQFFVAILTQDGTLLCQNRDAGQARPVIQGLDFDLVKQQQGVPLTVWNADRTGQWRVVSAPYQDDSTGAFVTLAVGASLADINATISQYTAVFLGFGLSVVVLGGAITRLLVTATFTPLREVEATAAAIANGDFSQRLPGATPNTEVGRLNRSLNTMLNRIDRAFADRAQTIDQMRRFVGDASHELRTPLVTVRGYAELYRMGALQTPEEVGQAMDRIEKEAVRMGGLVEDLLELARLDEAKPLQLAPVDLIPLARDAALDAMASAPDRTVTVIVAEPDAAAPVEEPPAAPSRPRRRPGPVASRQVSTATGPIAFAGATIARLRSRRARAMPTAMASGYNEAVELELPAVVLAEENKIRQVITNLLGNAMRFTPNGSPLELVVHVDPARKVGMLDIVDHGDGIPPQIRDKIFQRFWRADTSRTRATGGSGLGLAIVSGIIAAHKGSVDVLETPGGGATFRVALPLLPIGYTATSSSA